MSNSDRTEKPTPKRLREARREGRLPRSPEVGSYLALLAATWLLPMTVRSMTSHAQALFADIGQVISHPDTADAFVLMRRTMLDAAVVVAPLALTLLAVGVASSAAQGGVHLATKALRPKFSRLNPMQGLKRLVGPTSAVEAGKSVAKATVIGVVAWHIVHRLTIRLTAGGSLSLDEGVAATAAAIMQLARWTAVIGLVMAAGDYAFKRREAMKTLRMTKREIRDEHRQSEGDPHVKSHIRSRQLSISRNRMMREIATADVVLVNPTHVAVALRYLPGRGAPVVVAKGAGVLAARIRREAEQHRVPMVSDIPLARTVYKLCDIGQTVPPELYEAVARVLAFVFALRARAKATRRAGLPAPMPRYVPVAS